MVAVRHAPNPLSAISPVVPVVTPASEAEDRSANEDSSSEQQSDQAVASVRHLSRTVVSEIMNTATAGISPCPSSSK